MGFWENWALGFTRGVYQEAVAKSEFLSIIFCMVHKRVSDLVPFVVRTESVQEGSAWLGKWTWKTKAWLSMLNPDASL